MTQTLCPTCGAPSRTTLAPKRRQPARCRACHLAHGRVARPAPLVPRVAGDITASEIEELFRKAKAKIRADRRRLVAVPEAEGA